MVKKKALKNNKLKKQPSKKKILKKKQPKKKIVKKQPLKKKVSKKNQSYNKKTSIVSQTIEKFGLSLNNLSHDSLIVSKKTVIEGNVKLPKTLIIHGEVHGSIKVQNVHIIKNSKVRGEISADNIFIEGLCGSDIQVKKYCHIKSTAIIKGDINYDDNISIDQGARILGKLIPKRKPLALPNYHNSKPKVMNEYLEESNRVETEPINRSMNEINNLNIQDSKDDSFDKIIKKIFK